jgi:hypothetical protein
MPNPSPPRPPERRDSSEPHAGRADPRWLDTALAHAADALDRPLLVLHRDARLVWCNAAARALLDAAGGDWTLGPDTRLEPRAPLPQLAWRRALDIGQRPAGPLELARFDAMLPPGRLMPLGSEPIADDTSWLLLLPAKPRPPAAQRGGAAAPALADYARRFELDGSELALLPPLAGPAPLRQLARELRMSPSTLRRRALGICRKVQLDGLPALRRELAGLPPLRG